MKIRFKENGDVKFRFKVNIQSVVKDLFRWLIMFYFG
jgi:hypothetical protein